MQMRQAISDGLLLDFVIRTMRVSRVPANYRWITDDRSKTNIRARPVSFAATLVNLTKEKLCFDENVGREKKETHKDQSLMSCKVTSLRILNDYPFKLILRTKGHDERNGNLGEFLLRTYFFVQFALVIPRKLFPADSTKGIFEKWPLSRRYYFSHSFTFARWCTHGKQLFQIKWKPNAAR